MPNTQEPYTFDRVVRMVLTTTVLIGLFLLVQQLSDVLIPFAAAVVLAYLLNPLVTLFERKTKSRGFAVGITLVGLGLVSITFVVALIPLMAGQMSRFSTDFRLLKADLKASIPTAVVDEEPAGDAATSTPAQKSATGWAELADGWSRYRRADAGSRPEKLRKLRANIEGTYIGTVVDAGIRYVQSEEMDQFLVDAAKRLAIGGFTLVNVAVDLVLGATALIIVLLYTVFLLLDFRVYSKTWKAFLPPKYREGIVEFLTDFNDVLRRYFRGQSIVALLVGTVFAVGFTIIGLPMAVPFGLFVGLLNMVPYLQTVGLVPGVLLAVLQSVETESSVVVSIAYVLAVFAVAQVIQDALITPRIMGKATGLRPVSILLGVFIWGKLLGFLGLILAIPLTCLGIASYRRYVLTAPGAKES